MNKAKLAVLAGFLALAFLAGLAIWLDRAPAGFPVPPPLSGGALYAASFPDLNRREQSLGQWPQDWLLINFWATWCAPCREEMPILAKLQHKNMQRRFKVLGIAADSPANVANFAKDAKIDYLLYADEARAMEFSKRLGNTSGALPYSVLVQPGGEIVWTRSGPIDLDEASAMLERLLPKNP